MITPRRLRLGWILMMSTFLVPSCLNAQPGNEPDAPCQGATSTAEMSTCLRTAFQQAERDLNAVYQQTTKALEGNDLSRLRQTQRLWLQYRDANCAAARDLYEGGTAQFPAFNACLERMTRTRTHELSVTYVVRLKQ